MGVGWVVCLFVSKYYLSVYWLWVVGWWKEDEVSFFGSINCSDWDILMEMICRERESDVFELVLLG